MEGWDSLKQTPLLIICGPTAGGKTALAVELAIRLVGEVVSADSMQVYRRLDIGTAKPTGEEMRGVPHHLIGCFEPGEVFSVAKYVAMAKEAVADIGARGKLPILCGGTGLYIDSLTRNVRFPEMPENPALRQSLREQAVKEGNGIVWNRLNECDPELAETLHPNNLGRIIRAIEVYEATGIPMSEWQRRSLKEPSDYELCMLGLSFRDREALYRRINARVDAMLEQGLLEEARALFDEGLAGTAGQAIGYKELFSYFKGESSLETAVETLKRETRRYAKRQLTWLRRDERIHWLYQDDYAEPGGLAGEAFGLANGWLMRLNGVENGQTD